MNVSPDALRKEAVQLLTTIDKQIDEVALVAKSRGISSVSLVDDNGSFLLSPLLLAKAQCLSTLVQLNEPRKK